GAERRSIGNAVATISAAEELEKSAAPNLGNLIAARAPGVVIAPTTSRLGAGPAIQIRGRSSLSLENNPLLYIDGVRVNNATGTGPSGVSGGGPSFGSQSISVAGRLNDINPEDIESIEIIKGPAAATIYGTEAANGVIQIITKKGAAGRNQFNATVETGSLWFRDAEGRMPTNYMRDQQGNVVAWNAVQQEEERGTPLFKTGHTRQYSGSLSGGRDLLRYYLSGTYQNDLGIEPNNSLRQFSTHSNVNVAPNDKLDIGASINFVDLDAHLGVDNGVSAMLGAMVGHELLFSNARGFYPNFVPEIPQQLYDNSSAVTRFTSSGSANYRPFDWFANNVILGIDYTGDDSRALERFAPPNLAALLPASAAGGRIRQTLRRNTVITATYAGTATARLGGGAMTAATSVGGQFYREDRNQSSLGGWGFPGPGVETVSGTANKEDAAQTKTLNTTIGAYVEEKIGFRDRLFLTGGLRVDNNSAFGEDFKWVTYPKVAASWVVNEEPFWKFGNVVNTLKLRAAYGQSGRQPNAFAALRTFLPVPGPGGSNAVTPNSFGNPDLKPERGTELELGFEGELFNRLTLDFTYFNKRTEDVILNQPIAPSSGFPGQRFANLGRVDNHGIELSGTLRALTLPNVSWEIGGNVATNKDEIKDLGGLPSNVASAGQYNLVGYPIGAIFTRRVVSADRDPATGGATNVMCDGGPGQGAVPCNAQAPFVFIGTPTPKLSGAVSNTVTLWNRLRLYALVDFKRGHRMYNTNENLRCQGLVGVPLCHANYFPEQYSPIYLAETPGSAFALGMIDQFWQDASFVKLREVSGTFTFPDRWLWGGASRLALTVAARELALWTDYNGIDPEVNRYDIAGTALLQDQGIVPPLSRLIATLNVRF
ncbi:MAG TPA: SusC/RagA family TonB-linked outer membrane protein, partial [Gemmatimonadaceae bacterium]|nr:SusC/RagA family TonB-linked outer membrane protein [Gemmatimonadaceae bacterium]